MNLGKPLRNAIAKLDAMPQRDRYALLAAGAALFLGVEFMLIQPQQTLRESIKAATEAQRQEQATAQATAENERVQQKEALTAQLATLDQTLIKLGVTSGTVGTKGESLSFLLSRTLQNQPVSVVSLRTLDVEEMSVTPATEATAEQALMVVETPSESQSKLLFRHRYELRLTGDLNALTQAVQTLEDGVRPLRIERVRIASNEGALVAGITLVTVGLERSWLSL
jgi:type II secretory pathway component PulM